MRRWFVALVVAVLAIASVNAAAQDELAPVRKAFETMHVTWKAKCEGRRKAMAFGAPVRYAPYDPESEYGRLVFAYRDAQRAFMRAFRASDWESLRGKDDRDLLRVGLTQVLLTSLRGDDLDPGVRAAELLIRSAPEAAHARYARAWRLPLLIAERDGAAASLKRSTQLLEAAFDDTERASLERERGDALAALGRAKDAVAAWKRSAALGDRWAPRRVEVFDRKAPALPDGKWVPEREETTDAPTLLLFMGSADYEGLAAAVRVDALRREIGLDRLNVVGVVYPVNGILIPENRAAALARDHHERVGGDCETAMADVRRRLGLSFPLLVNTPGDWGGEKQYLLESVLLDGDGKVVAFGAREGRLGVLAEAARRLAR